MPNCVLECLNRHYMQDNANVHRGIHTLSERSTCAMEDARKTVADLSGVTIRCRSYLPEELRTV